MGISFFSNLSPILADDTRTPDVFACLSWDNDESGTVGSSPVGWGGGWKACNPTGKSAHIAEVRSNDDDFYGSYVSFNN